MNRLVAQVGNLLCPPTGSRPGAAPAWRPADCQSATRQTGSLRYGSRAEIAVVGGSLVLSLIRDFGRKIGGRKMETEIFLPIIFLPPPFSGSWSQCAACESWRLLLNQPGRARCPHRAAEVRWHPGGRWRAEDNPPYRPQVHGRTRLFQLQFRFRPVRRLRRRTELIRARLLLPKFKRDHLLASRFDIPLDVVGANAQNLRFSGEVAAEEGRVNATAGARPEQGLSFPVRNDLHFGVVRRQGHGERGRISNDEARVAQRVAQYHRRWRLGTAAGLGGELEKLGVGNCRFGFHHQGSPRARRTADQATHEKCSQPAN